MSSKSNLPVQDSERRLWVFDFDDTLVTTDARVKVTHLDGRVTMLTPAEFAVYEQRPGDVLDYTEFRQLINPRAIAWTGKILRNIYETYGPKALVILSARSTPDPIMQFLSSLGLEGIEIVALDSANPLVKASWVDRWIRERSLQHVEFYDDSPKNVEAIRQLVPRYPNVTLNITHVVGRKRPRRQPSGF